LKFKSTYQSYHSTNAFSKLVTDYLDNATPLQSFYAYAPDWNGLQKSISSRTFSAESRKVLTTQLELAYRDCPNAEIARRQIRQLERDNTFTVCAAHQPNILTGPLYFIYKIMHCIVLAQELNQRFSDKHFIPIYFMGAEDADLQELGIVNVDGVKQEWDTQQRGAVGRMYVDDALLGLIDSCANQWNQLPYGTQVSALVHQTYVKGKTIADATHDLVHTLFGDHGLLVFNPDQAAFKNLMRPIFEQDLSEHLPYRMLQQTISKFPSSYKVQLSGRPVNLFYLKDDVRSRIEKDGDGYNVIGTDIKFTANQILQELYQCPERFSPNAVLRPLMQETCLPNVAFIGGGGELAYWMELKNIFDHYGVHFPLLLLRNSFLIIDAETTARINKIGLKKELLFSSSDVIINELLMRQSGDSMHLEEHMIGIKKIYTQLSAAAGKSDPTLTDHVAALEKQAIQKIEGLQKKILRAEKHRQEVTVRKILQLKESLFPEGKLQERSDNFLYFLAKYGPDLIDELFRHSQTLDAGFCVLHERA
jgi:bacillithiol biosynthesis cysteine-adding enzyme BshC